MPLLPGGDKYNPNPKIFVPLSDSYRTSQYENIWPDINEFDGGATELDGQHDTIDEQEVFDLLRSMTDPELPSTLEELHVLARENVSVCGNNVRVLFTPTTPHCGAAHIIGIAIQVRLSRSLPARFRSHVGFTPGSYNTIDAVTKQLNDKERVAAAMEAQGVSEVVEACLATAHMRGRKLGNDLKKS